MAGRIKYFTVLIGLLVNGLTFGGGQEGFGGEVSQWHGYKMHKFSVDGRNCIVVLPERAAEDRLWVWRARFFGHEPQVDIALLGRGFHLAYMDVAGLYGSPKAVKHWDAFYKYLVEERGFAKKAALEGMSRGGLIIYNWAAANPDKVACIYGDAPVCDFKSWPGGKGRGKGSASDWLKCLEAYGLTGEQALEYHKNPIDNLEPLAAAKTPLLNVCGATDQVVPLEENTRILERRYRELGGNITVIAKQGVGHHPHSLKDPEYIVQFILSHTIGSGDYYTLRGDLDNCRVKFKERKKGRVAFLGGSITHNPGWRPMVMDYLQKRFEEIEIDFINAGVPSTGSTPGAFRLERDVFGQGQVDLLFVEAAVNDSTNGRTTVEQIRGMEGVLRHARQLNPDIDIVVMYFVDPAKMAQYDQGVVPDVIWSHERAAIHYNVTSIDLALEVTERIKAGEFTWKDDFKNLHPAPFGQRLYFNTIKRMFETAWKEPAGRSVKAHPLPKAPIDPQSYYRGRLVDIKNAELIKGWKYDPLWSPPGGDRVRKGFVNVAMLTTETAGAELKFGFQGRAVGIFVAAGHDAGMIEYSIDGGQYKRRDMFTAWSKHLHLPWAYVLNGDLSNGAHELTIRTIDDKNSAGSGNAVRIVHFLVN